MKKFVLTLVLFILLISAASGVSHAHHNSNVPDGVDPLWVGIDLYSYHNDAIDHALSVSQSDDVMPESNMDDVDGSTTQTSTQDVSQSGSTSRTRR